MFGPAAIYFVLFITIGAFVLANVIIGVTVMNLQVAYEEFAGTRKARKTRTTWRTWRTESATLKTITTTTNAATGGMGAEIVGDGLAASTVTPRCVQMHLQT